MFNLGKIIPHRITNNDLIDGEKIIMIIHRHIFYLFRKLFFIMIIGILLWITGITSILTISSLDTNIKNISYPIIIGLFILFNLMIFIKILYVWIDYHFDNLYITNMRVIHLDRHFIYGQSVKEIALNRITTIRSECLNIIANILGFARLDIDSADDGQHIKFDYTPQVDIVRKLVTSQKEAFMHFIQEHNSSDGSENSSSNSKYYEETATKNDTSQSQATQTKIVTPTNLINVESFHKEFEEMKAREYYLHQRVEKLEESIKKLMS